MRWVDRTAKRSVGRNEISHLEGHKICLLETDYFWKLKLFFTDKLGSSQVQRKVKPNEVTRLMFSPWYLVSRRLRTDLAPSVVRSESRENGRLEFMSCSLCYAIHKRTNRPFYNCVLNGLALEWQRGWRWPCFDTDLTAFVV